MENEWIKSVIQMLQMAAPVFIGFAWLWARLDKKFEALEKRFEAIDRKFEMVFEELREIRKDISKIDSRLSRIEGIYEERNMGELRLIARGEKGQS